MSNFIQLALTFLYQEIRKNVTTLVAPLLDVFTLQDGNSVWLSLIQTFEYLYIPVCLMHRKGSSYEVTANKKDKLK